ncbi:MAG: 30S ribosomal protein S8 [bacterium]|nr:30S ribosomal protein S8 [bacterium]MDA1024558.1 30S ribosomal protein S8 [bacterium]
MTTDPISDMLTRLRNATAVRKETVDVPLSKVKFAISKILEKEGYVERVETVEVQKRPVIRMHLKYDGRTPAFSSVKRVSKPGRRVYVKATEIKSVQNGFGLSILSTPNGMMTGTEAKKRRLGGELICELF